MHLIWEAAARDIDHCEDSELNQILVLERLGQRRRPPLSARQENVVRQPESWAVVEWAVVKWAVEWCSGLAISGGG